MCRRTSSSQFEIQKKNKKQRETEARKKCSWTDRRTYATSSFTINSHPFSFTLSLSLSRAVNQHSISHSESFKYHASFTLCHIVLAVEHFSNVSATSVNSHHIHAHLLAPIYIPIQTPKRFNNTYKIASNIRKRLCFSFWLNWWVWVTVRINKLVQEHLLTNEFWSNAKTSDIVVVFVIIVFES